MFSIHLQLAWSQRQRMLDLRTSWTGSRPWTANRKSLAATVGGPQTTRTWLETWHATQGQVLLVPRCIQSSPCRNWEDMRQWLETINIANEYEYLTKKIFLQLSLRSIKLGRRHKSFLQPKLLDACWISYGNRHHLMSVAFTLYTIKRILTILHGPLKVSYSRLPRLLLSTFHGRARWCSCRNKKHVNSAC